jgi:hypothetical protein
MLVFEKVIIQVCFDDPSACYVMSIVHFGSITVHYCEQIFVLSRLHLFLVVGLYQVTLGKLHLHSIIDIIFNSTFLQACD